jgi:hypothetical protein
MKEATGQSRTELEKFDESIAKNKDRKIFDPEIIKQIREVKKEIDGLNDAEQTKKRVEAAKQFRVDVANSLQSIGENVGAAGAAALPDRDQRLHERNRVLQEAARSIEQISRLKIDRERFAGIVDLFKSGNAALDVPKALADIGTALQSVRGELGPEFDKTVQGIFNLLNGGRQADADLFAALTPLGQAQREYNDLLSDQAALSDPLVASQTIQNELLRDKISLQQRDLEAVIATNRAQLELADATTYHATQANAKVVEFLAHQKNITEVVADAKTGVMQTTFDLIDRGLDRWTSKLGIIGNLAKQILSDFIRLALTPFFAKLFGVGQGSAQGPGGGGIGGTIAQGLFGGGTFSNARNTVTGGYAGGPGAGSYLQNAVTQRSGQFFSGLNVSGGGVGTPTSLSSQLENQGAISSAIHEAGHTGTAATTGALAGANLTTTIAAALPLLGLSIGSQLGGESRFGRVAGAAGGLLAGGVGAAFLAPGLFATTGVFGSLGPAIAGLLTNPFTIAAAGALIVGALILAKNAARRRDEKQRAAYIDDAYAQLKQIYDQVRTDKMDGPQAIAAAMAIRSNYLTQANSLKDTKTRNIALKDVSRIDTWINDFLKPASDAQNRRREIEKHLIPEFATGGMVPYRTSLFSMATGLTPIKVRPGEVMIPPGGFGVEVPGVDRGYDSVYTMARPGTRVLTRSQQSSAQGFALGGTFGPSDNSSRERDGEGDIVFNVSDEGTAAMLQMLLAEVDSPEGRQIVVKHMKSYLKNGN